MSAKQSLWRYFRGSFFDMAVTDCNLFWLLGQQWGLMKNNLERACLLDWAKFLSKLLKHQHMFYIAWKWKRKNDMVKNRLGSNILPLHNRPYQIMERHRMKSLSYKLPKWLYSFSKCLFLLYIKVSIYKYLIVVSPKALVFYKFFVYAIKS